MENNKKEKLSIPAAIIVAGFIIALGILVTKSGNPSSIVPAKDKTLSEQVGVSKEALDSCIKEIDATALSKSLSTSVENAMSGVPSDQRGTPYSVIIGKDGTKTEVLGNDSYESLKKTIDDIAIGKVTKTYTGKIDGIQADDHILGNSQAPVVIIEYSDYECPYCKAFHSTAERIVQESNGGVAWVYRHWPIHQNSFTKLSAAECVAKIKGNDAFWKYSKLLFGLLKTENESVSDKL